MATPIIMPRQGQSVETCILTSVYKSPGEKVKKGDLLFAYETDKASFEEEAPEDGVFLGSLYEEGDEIPVLETVCLIGRPGEDISAHRSSDSSDQEAPPAEASEPSASVPSEAQASPENRTERIRISPRARKRASEEDVPVDQLQGSGPNGRILDRDVMAWVNRVKETSTSDQGTGGASDTRPEITGAPVSGDYKEEPLSHMRKIIAGAMHRSLQNSAQLTHHLSADARQLLDCRKMAKETDTGLTLNDFVCYAVVKTLRAYPRVNAHLDNEILKVFGNVHLGLAVDTERGLMVPAVKNAGDLNVHGLAARLHQLAEKSRKGNIDPELLSPETASFTVSNLGNYGVEMFTPVINLPQVAILGVNTIVYRPVPTDNGGMSIVPFLGLSLTYDHRALDGGEATRFLRDVARQIEQLDPISLNER